MKACPDDPLPIIVDLAASEELSLERESAILWALSGGSVGGLQAPRELVAQLRLHERRRLGPEAAALLALAAQRIGDPDFLAIAQPWSEATEGPLLDEAADCIEALWETTPLEALDETQQYVGAASTIQRDVPRIGRNDPR